MVGITYPSDWKQITGDRYISAVSADGQAYSMIATLEGAADKPSRNRKGQARARKVSSGHQVRQPDKDETRCARAHRHGKWHQVRRRRGVRGWGLRYRARQLAGAAFVVDGRIEDHYKETVRQICQTIRVADQLAEKK